jgi:hypothetical protein
MFLLIDFLACLVTVSKSIKIAPKTPAREVIKTVLVKCRETTNRNK